MLVIIINYAKTDSANSTTFKWQYLRQDRCNDLKSKALSEAKSSCSHKEIGLGAAVVLLAILLLIVTGGWAWTCLILRKTTEIRYIYIYIYVYTLNVH